MNSKRSTIFLLLAFAFIVYTSGEGNPTREARASKGPSFSYMPPQRISYWAPPPAFGQVGVIWAPPIGMENYAQPWGPPSNWPETEKWEAPPEF